MDKFDIKSMFKIPSPEEMEQMMRETYERNMDTPENFSLWYADLSRAIDSSNTGFTYPKSFFVIFKYELMNWLRGDKYTEEGLEEFNDLIINMLKPLDWIREGNKFFIKSGTYSNKFDYSKSCELSKLDNIGKQFQYIFYDSMIKGADSTNELVIREYIETDMDEKIYNGMPLRTEFRVFVDIKGEDSELIDVVNYWHPELMNKYLFGEDLETYKRAEKRLVSEFNNNKSHVADNVLEIAKNIDTNAKVLHGKWSIDVMLEGDKFYVIDCARMNRSALVEYVGK